MAIKTPAVFDPANATMLHTPEGNIPTEHTTKILQDVMTNSVIMQLARFEPMTSTKKEIDLFLGGLGAYWVGEGQRIETSKPTWTKGTLEAKKVGVILPVSREYLHYKQADFFNFMKPFMAEALYKKFDQAAILGVDNPFTQSVDASATAASQLTEGELTVETVNGLTDQLNASGFEPNGYVSTLRNNTILRGLVEDNNGLKTRIFNSEDKTIGGIPALDLHRDLNVAPGTLYAGDFNQAYYGIPYNMTYKISEEATLTTIVGEDGEPLNLFEREMAAIRVTMDVAFLIVNDAAFAGIKAPVVEP